MKEGEEERGRDLKDGGIGGDEGEGGLDAAGGVDGGGGLNEAALEGVDVSGGGLVDLRGVADLLGAPFAGAAPADEGEDSHSNTLCLSVCLFVVSLQPERRRGTNAAAISQGRKKP